MLPPDTSSNMLLWRVMVPLMQFYGYFPYRMSATSTAPVFSLPLFLWSVFVQVFIVGWSCMSYERVLNLYTNPDVGILVFLYSGGAMMSSLTLVPFALVMKSNKLASLLRDLSQIKDAFPVPTHRWYCQPKTLIILFLAITGMTMLSWFSYDVIEATYFTMPLVLYWSMLCSVNFFLPESLFTVMLDLLSRRLTVATEAKFAAVSSLLAPDGSFNRESDVKEAMVALRDLDAIFREVEEQREEGTRCFFLVITMFLLMGLQLAIACPYAILHGTLQVMGGIVIVVFFIGFYVIARYCYLGQTFVNQASRAEKLLKDLRIKSQNQVFCVQVSHVMARLTPLLTFDMCGWYTLGYSSFLGLMNTVLTYVVIIFQIGGNDTTLNSPSSVTTLSPSPP